MMPACPACTAPELVQGSKFELQCSYCRSIFSGKPLICPACGWINTLGADLCQDCAEPMNVVSQVISRQNQPGTPQWLQRVQDQASGIKSNEEQASRKRIEVLEGIDRRREEAQRTEMELQRRKDKEIILGVFIIFVVVIVILLVLVFFQGQSSV